METIGLPWDQKRNFLRQYDLVQVRRVHLSPVSRTPLLHSRFKRKPSRITSGCLLIPLAAGSSPAFNGGKPPCLTGAHTNQDIEMKSKFLHPMALRSTEISLVHKPSPGRQLRKRAGQKIAPGALKNVAISTETSRDSCVKSPILRLGVHFSEGNFRGRESETLWPIFSERRLYAQRFCLRRERSMFRRIEGCLIRAPTDETVRADESHHDRKANQIACIRF